MLKKNDNSGSIGVLTWPATPGETDLAGALEIIVAERVARAPRFPDELRGYLPLLG